MMPGSPKKVAVKRRCRFVKKNGKACGKALPVRRYFHCEDCVLPAVDYAEPRGAIHGSAWGNFTHG